MDALILAGRKGEGPLASRYGVAAEAVVNVGGRPMIEIVVKALQRSRRLGRIVVVGPEAILRPVLADSRAEVISPGETLVENLRRGLDVLTTDRDASGAWILISTSDLPLLTQEAVDDFLDRCATQQAKIFYPVVARETYLRRFPGSRRTYVRLREGTFTGGNLVLIEAQTLRDVLPWIEQAYRARKRPIELAKLLGFPFVLRFLLGRLSVSELERRASELLGAPGRAVVTEKAEIGFDVDRPEDVTVAESYLRDAGDDHGPLEA